MTTPQSPRTHDLSKSRYMAGVRCSKYLWLKVHEPKAPELAITEKLQDLFNQGNQVGELARAAFPGGVLVDLPHHDPRRVALTRELLASAAPAVFEATFIAERTFVAVDVLLRDGAGFTLIEVKSGSEVKDKYVQDAALQTYVARASGVPVTRVEIMHLNRDYVHGAGAELLMRTDVTALIEPLQRDIPDQLAAQLAALAGPQPEVAIGQHCRDDSECPFMGRCWPDQKDGVLNIHALRFDKRFELHQQGVKSIAALPQGFKLNEVQTRQRRAIETRQVVVEPKLGEALEAFQGRLGFLDFESVSRAVPRWDGTRPWQNVGVQFSYHEFLPDGSLRHAEYLAPSDCDPRAEIAQQLIDTTRDADCVLMYTPFEKTQIGLMQQFNPSLTADLQILKDKLQDLKHLVHYNVYHGDFGGSFSLKDVLPVLVPGMSYKDTVTIHDGQEASAKLARLLFYAYTLTDIERAILKKNLLAYCKQDTFAMVKLLERLRALA